MPIGAHLGRKATHSHCVFIFYYTFVLCRDAEAGFNKCHFCAFENFKRTPFCNVCGAKVREYESHLEAHTAQPQWSTLSLRQRRARCVKAA